MTSRNAFTFGRDAGVFAASVQSAETSSKPGRVSFSARYALFLAVVCAGFAFFLGWRIAARPHMACAAPEPFQFGFFALVAVHGAFTKGRFYWRARKGYSDAD